MTHNFRFFNRNPEFVGIEEVLSDHHKFIKSFFGLSQDHKIIRKEDNTDVDGVKIDPKPRRI